VVVNPCSVYQTNPSPALLEDCNGFLGPTQPGVTTPDPTETSQAASAAAAPAQSRRPRARRPARPASSAVATQRPARDGLLDYLLTE
jgi:hypothetical protein